MREQELGRELYDLYRPLQPLSAHPHQPPEEGCEQPQEDGEDPEAGCAPPAFSAVDLDARAVAAAVPARSFETCSERPPATEEEREGDRHGRSGKDGADGVLKEEEKGGRDDEWRDEQDEEEWQEGHQGGRLTVRGSFGRRLRVSRPVGRPCGLRRT